MNIFKIHFFTYIFIVVIIINGYFNKFIDITCIILIHELGHILAGLILKWKIDRIVLLPFGCLTIFNEKINRPLIEEFIIAVAGPIFQIIYMFFLEDTYYAKILLLFNLLPIYPLDGYKIYNIFLNNIFSFKLSHLISIYTSFIVLLLLRNNLIVILVVSLLLLNIVKELLNHKYIFNKFILERKLYSFDFKKVKLVKSVKEFKRDYKHVIKEGNIYIKEREYLRNN